MQLYKKPIPDKMRKRKVNTINIEIEEKPERPKYVFKNNKDRKKFILMIESLIRKSGEYKTYIRFLKNTMDWNRCAILKNAITGNGKRYSIEIHHEPFTLFDLVETVLNKFDVEGKEYNPFAIAEEVMGLHYDGRVGLINLTKTQHELLHNGRIFVPLQFIYHDYGSFFNEYEPFMTDNLKEKIKLKVAMSMKCENIQSNILEPEFTYISVDGFNFPDIPKLWGEAIQTNLDNSLLNQR